MARMKTKHGACCEDKARRLLDKAERSCLITNSLIANSHLEAEVRVTGVAT